MPEIKLRVEEQFDDAHQQQEVSLLGLWLFLATEVLFFGGLFMAFVVYHVLYPVTFAYGGQHTNLLYGSINTILLLTSGLTVALAVNAIRRDRIKVSLRFLWVTILLGLGFLAVKGLEYADDFQKHLNPGPSFSLPGRPASEMFFYLYWLMTGLHAVHLIVGIGVLVVIAFLTSRNRYSGQYYTPLELSALYWGFVDVVWIYLYPLLYLIDRHGAS